MYEHVTDLINDIESEGFANTGLFSGDLTWALYNPEIVDKEYFKTLEEHGLEGSRAWNANVEALDLAGTLALLTFVHRADHFCEGTLAQCLEDGFVYRVLLRLRELDSGVARPNIVGFWKEEEHLGCCSNWHPTGFDYCGTHFATSEHWMMWQKARVLGDHEMADRILEAPTPRKAKELGGKVSNYDGELWGSVREQLVYYGVREKFLTNALNRNLLLSTGSALLAEASPNDSIWGVGMTADDPDFANPANWKGDNLLGRVCMRVRADIRQLHATGRNYELANTYDMPDDQIANMTLLQLSRIPSTRNAIYCYASIVSHAVPDIYPTPGSYLKTMYGATVAGVSEAMSLNMGGGLPVAGWHELVRELNFQRFVGRL